MDQILLYSFAGIIIFAVGLAGFLLTSEVIRKILAINIMGSGIFMLLIATAAQYPDAIDPIPQAMVLTGIVVAAAGSALALTLSSRISGYLAPVSAVKNVNE